MFLTSFYAEPQTLLICNNLYYVQYCFYLFFFFKYKYILTWFRLNMFLDITEQIIYDPFWVNIFYIHNTAKGLLCGL